MLDEGSTVTMVDAQIAEKLGLQGPTETLCVQWTHELCREETNSRRVSLEISGDSGSKKFQLRDVRTVAQMSLPRQTVDMEKMIEVWQYLQDIPFHSMVNAQPKILIGSDNILLTTPRKLRQGHWRDPVATKTWLGWVVHGNLPKGPNVDCNYAFHVCEKPSTEELSQLIRESFSTEGFGVKLVGKQKLSTSDERAMRILESTTSRVGERFQTGLLWKADGLSLPESRTNALRRLHCMERKMDRNPDFAEAYCTKIDEYISKGYCRKLSKEESMKKGPRTFYLSHFAVFNPQKPGKLRLVFDAAARTHGVSLNDCLLKGPDFLNPLPAVLLRFRRHRVGIVGDIREMFHQVRIISEDVDSQRFLWRGKQRNGDPEEFIMQVMIFGAACSPCSALYVKNVNAREMEGVFPDAAKSAIENTYMDDNLHGAYNDEEATVRIQESIQVFERGDFLLSIGPAVPKK